MDSLAETTVSESPVQVVHVVKGKAAHRHALTL